TDERYFLFAYGTSLIHVGIGASLRLSRPLHTAIFVELFGCEVSDVSGKDNSKGYLIVFSNYPFCRMRVYQARAVRTWNTRELRKVVISKIIRILHSAVQGRQYE